MSLEPEQVQALVEGVQNGSPMLLGAVGRAFGLGQAEQQAVAKGEFPLWAVALVSLGVGAVAGVWAAKQWPALKKL